MSENFNEIDKTQEESIDIKKLLFKYLAHWKWFVLSLAAFLLIGCIYLYIKTPLYEIKASILIKDNKSMGGGTGAASMLEELDMFSSKKMVENEIEILRSYTLLEKVVKDLNLQVTYTKKKGLRDIELYNHELPVKVELMAASDKIYEEPIVLSFTKNGQLTINQKNYPKNALITEDFGSIRTTVNDSLLAFWDKQDAIHVSIAPINAVVEGLRQSLDVKTSSKGTTILNLSILASIPQKGKDMLNQLLAVYSEAAIADKNNLARVTLEFIDDRLKLLSIDLQGAEQKVEQYKSEQGITDISTESRLFLESAQKNDMELSKVDIQLSVLKSVEHYVLRNDNTGSTTPATLGINDPTLLSLITSLVTLEAQRTKSLYTMKSENPAIKALDDQINGMKRSIIDNIQVMRHSLEITQTRLKAENRRIENMIQSVPKKERELVDITRQQEIKNQLYIYLLSKREETAISYASTVADSRIVDPARSSLKPVKPVKRLIILIFGLLGLLIPIGILWLKDLLDTKIASKEEVEKKIHVPIIGEISFLEQASKILSLHSKGKQAEQIRTLRTNLGFMQAGGGIQTILITSSISGEGKSFLSANLGAAFAALGKKVVILGFDLRRPGLHIVFGLDNEVGLSNYLAGQASVDQIVRKIEQIDNLNIITAGHIPPNPQELLQGDTLPKLFEELKKRYDYIIVDTAPVGLVSDAQILDVYANVSIFVVRQNYTPKDRIKFIHELYTAKKLTNLGVVVNGIKEEKWHGYYASYGSEKYYGNYYGEEDGQKKKRFKLNKPKKDQ